MTPRERIVFVPGLGISGLEMIPLLARMRRVGYAVQLFQKAPGFRGLERSASLLRKQLEFIPEPVVHFVGHSLGGLVILRMLASGTWTRPGRIVTIGTPHSGLRAARALRFIPRGRRIFLGVQDAVTVREIPLGATRELGTIAGIRRLPWGGLLVPAVPSDGVVAETETRHAESRAHLTLAESHGTLLVAGRVAKSVNEFLREGRFSTEAGAGGLERS